MATKAHQQLRTATRTMAEIVADAAEQAHKAGVAPRLGFVLVTYVSDRTGVDVVYASTSDNAGTQVVLRSVQEMLAAEAAKAGPRSAADVRRELDRHDSVCSDTECVKRAKLVDELRCDGVTN